MPQAQSAVERQLRWLLRLLQEWLDDPGVTDIFINGPDQLFMKRQGRNAGRETSPTDRHLMDLYRAENWRAFLHLAVANGKNVVFAGEVGSGKTHNLRAFTNSIRLSARIVTIEDMPQILGLPHENVANMLYSEGGQGTARIAAEDLIVAALRIGMDVLLMQELRNAAAFAYLRALASGHPGMTTCLAASAEGAFDAIRLVVKQHQAGRHLADDDVRAMLTSLIDVVAHCECRDGRYRMTEIWVRPSRQGQGSTRYGCGSDGRVKKDHSDQRLSVRWTYICRRIR